MSGAASKIGLALTARLVAFWKLAPQRSVLGIDLAGPSSAKTGYALIQGGESPYLIEAGALPVADSPLDAEVALLDLIDGQHPDVLTIDAPLTLPPCLTCPSHCRGPGADLCELQSAREMWERGSNPVSRRPCELEAKEMIPRLDPKPTMGLGAITARAVALVRKLENRGEPPASITRREVLEVYPRATLARLGNRDPHLEPRRRGEEEIAYRRRVIAGLEGDVVGLRGVTERRSALESSPDVLDAVIAAYTGWLAPGGLEEPPDDFNLASGWIWFPKAV
jgi:predicted nuclease with RNAse H fold